MAIIIPVHRALSSKIAGRSFQNVTRYNYFHNLCLGRVNHQPIDRHELTSTQQSSQLTGPCGLATRTYATAAAPKSKAAPGRATTRRSTAKKPGPKTAAGKKKVGAKPKAKKPTKAKAKAKKPLAKRVVKKAPTKSALAKKRRLQVKDLKEKALLDPPKKLPESPWQLIFSEAHKSSKDFDRSGIATKEAAQKLKNLTPEDKEHYNHLAHSNKDKNDIAWKKWLSSHTPEQIKEANNARRRLKADYKAKHPTAKSVKKFQLLKDDRLVKQPQTPYNLFTKDRHASGDFLRMTIAESSKLIGREWKGLNTAEKTKFEDQFHADQRRYVEEHKSVYGVDPPSRKPKASS